ncbi:MAG: hypothetical protein ACJ8CR_17650 [Roseiflexaceae bacterium]
MDQPPITAQIRIIATSQEEATAICGYLWRISARHVIFTHPKPGRDGEWLAYGTVELPRSDINEG